MENSFKSILDRSKSILILLPTKPLFDQFAAGLALYLSLKQEKDIQVFSPEPVTVEFNRIIGVNKIAHELGNKNLVIKFVGYKAQDIERVSYDIEDSQFKLTVVPRQNVTPPTKDQVDLSYSGISFDTIIMIGGLNESHFPSLSHKELSGANIVHIGVRDLSLSYEKAYISFSRPASSVSEVVASLIKESGLLLDEDIATNLLMGIESATNNFISSQVTAETFAIISDLMRVGGKRGFLKANKPVASGYMQGLVTKPFANIGQPLVQKAPQAYDNLSQEFGKDNQEKVDTPRTQDDQASENEMDAPNDWLKPKIFKGSSIS